MNTALIVVDVQNDFLPGGPLGVPNGFDVIEPLVEAMRDADVIVITSDWHPVNHFSFSENPEFRDGSWPPHCVQDTHGAEVYDEIWNTAEGSGKLALVVSKGTEQDKEAYSGFDGRVVEVLNGTYVQEQGLPGLMLGNALLTLGIRHVKIGGLALDYCVKATAIDSRSRFGDTTVLMKATRPVDYLTGVSAIVDMSRAGVRLDSGS